MKVLEISNKVVLVRHWGKWYRVLRGAADWQDLKPHIRGDYKRAGKQPHDPIDDLSPAEAAAELEKRMTR